MDTKQILTDLRIERDRIDRAITVLEGLDGAGRSSVTAPSAQPAPVKARGRRRMSAAARKKIAEAQRKRWAAQKSGAKQAAPKQTAAKRKVAKGGISTAGRKRLSEMMKKRWAERRKQKAKAA